MEMKLQEVHPALVHFPITLLPLALAADAAGKLSGKRELRALGRWGIAAAAVSGLVAGVFGLMAQEQVEPDDEARDMLITHRTLNLGAVGILGAMALRRARRDKPSLGYLAAGLATLGVVSYSAYLGGRMVYGHGVGVEKAGGALPAVPAIGQDKPAVIARRAARDMAYGAAHAVQEMAGGELAPTLSGGPEQS